MGFFNFSNPIDNVREKMIDIVPSIKEVYSSSIPVMQTYFSAVQENANFKVYGIQLCINRISNAIVKSDFKTLKKGRYIEGHIWYQLNVEPNKNENASQFWEKVVSQMAQNTNGALVIQLRDGSFRVADYFTSKKFATKENVYSNVSVDGYTFKTSFLESEVFHFEMNNSKIKKILDSVYDDYGKLLGGSIKNYNRSNALKFIVELDAVIEQWQEEMILDENGEETGETKFDSIMDDLFNERFANFLGENDAIMPLEKGLTLNDMNASGSSKSSGSAANKTTRDINALFDDVLNMCADAFNIPRGILKGDVADAEALTDNFIAFGVNPIAENIETEINRKLYGKANVLAQTKVQISTDGIKNYDIAKLATSAELLARIGVLSVNGMCKLLKLEQIDEDWANEHIMSKNYEFAEVLSLRGGETNAGKV